MFYVFEHMIYELLRCFKRLMMKQKEEMEVYKMRPYILFDFDGTIADSEKAILLSWNKVAEQYGYTQVKPEDIPGLKKYSIREVSQRLNFNMRKIPILMPKFYRLYQHAMKDVGIFPGMKELMIKLEEKGYSTAILSSNSKDNILTFLNRHGLTQVTNVYTSSSLFGKDRLIKKFLRGHRLKTSDVIYVGDELRDVVACKKVGIKIIWVSWGLNSYEAVKEALPDFCAEKPMDILRFIESKI